MMHNPTPESKMFAAISFAARAHRHQVRKDNTTPYVAHVMRVGLVVRHIFGIDDAKVLATAFLHDTIEDTPTDFNDIAETFGEDVASWVAALTKDMRAEDNLKEQMYLDVLTNGPWQVQVCKLADIYDNMHDSQHLSPKSQKRTLARSRHYLDAIRAGLKPEAEKAWQVVETCWGKFSGA